MLTPERKAGVAAQRKRLKEWLAGPHDRPLVFTGDDVDFIDAILFPSFASHVAHIIRYLVVRLGDLAPVCPVKVFFYRLAGAKIGKNVCISPGGLMEPLYPCLVELEDAACLGTGARLMAHEYTATEFRLGRIRVGGGSVIGMFSTVRGGVTIGRKVTVGAHSFVNRDVPDHTTVGGVPARPLKSPTCQSHFGDGTRGDG